MKFAPIVLFVYNRLSHTKQTVKALKNNELAAESDFVVFSDGPRKDSEETVAEIREYLKTITGFKSVKIVESPENRGLAASIIDGVTQVVNQYGKIIVLEDDLVTSPTFLTFMNNALDFYQNKKEIWHISGWSPNLKLFRKYNEESYFSRLAYSWSWATWSDRWQYFEKDTDKLISTFTPKMIKEFNLGGNTCFWPQVLFNKSGKWNTWAIYWYAIIFLNKGLCVNPTKSYCANIGQDGSGEHCKGGNGDDFNLNEKSKLTFPSDVKEDTKILKALRQHYKEPGLPGKVIRKIRKIWGRKK